MDPQAHGHARGRSQRFLGALQHDGGLKLDGLHTCAVVLSKWDVNNANAISLPSYLYGWVLRLLIEQTRGHALSI